MDKKLFIGPFIALSLLGLISLFILELTIKNWQLNQIRQDLERVAHSTVESLLQINADGSHYEMELAVDQIIGQGSQYHLSLINQNGLVLGDSILDADGIKNLSNQGAQPEVVEALETGSGSTLRFSEKLDTDLLYAAVRYHYGDNIGIARVSAPLNHLYSTLLKLRLILLGIFVSFMAAVAGLGALFGKHLSQRISDQHHDLEQRVEERTQEIQLLQRLASLLAACDSFDEAQQVVQDVVPRILGSMNGGVSLYKQDSNQLELCMDWNGLWPGEQVFERSDCWAIRKGRFHFSNDKHSTLYCQHMENKEHHETLCVPLLSHGTTIGIMHLIIDDVTVDQVFEQLAFSIAEHLGLALANLNLHETLRQQAIRDPLTGLYNRRFLEEALEKEVNRSQRHNNELTVMMLDMDHFKRFNDTFGHDAGDYVLKTLGKTLADRVRKEDIACRIGGEEMALILPDTNLEGAKVLADMLCNIIRRMHLTFHGQELGQLSVSIGIAGFPHHGHDGTELLKSADVALYNAKESGRDQFQICKVETEAFDGPKAVEEQTA
jgi:diguanylate cyclase (GGDEF)-like protein